MDSGSFISREISDFKLTKFVSAHIGWTFNFIFAHLLFWIYGFPAVLKYGYNDEQRDSDGNIPSGPSGSGVFIVSTLLVIGATLIWTKKFFQYDENEDEEVEDDKED